MFFGHPLERLCTYQYSLVTMMPGEVHPLGLHRCHSTDPWCRTDAAPGGLWFSPACNSGSYPHAANISQNLESQEHDDVSRFTLGSFRKGEQ